MHASYSRQEGLAASVLKDVIAEPYRAALIEGFNEVRAQGAQNGALATGISGSGPTVFVVMKDLAHTGMTMMCVTHEMGFARQAADQVVFMDEGRVVEIGTPQELFDNPRSERLQTFLSQVL